MLIVTRYLCKDILATLVVVLSILLLIFISNEFVRYLTSAAAGKISGTTVFKIMALQVPYLSGLLLPAALFMSFLLVYSRLYAENEMTVLRACGMSRTQLLRISLSLATAVFFIDMGLNTYLNPLLLNYKNKLLANTGPATLIETVQPGRFITTPKGDFVYYIESVSRNHQKMKGIFIAKKIPAHQDTPASWEVSSAHFGQIQVDPKTQSEWVVASQGFRYQGLPGQGQFKVLEFGEYRARLGTTASPVKHNYEGLPLTVLWSKRHESPKILAEIEWRFSVALMVPILTLLVIPLSYVRPREGRYAKLLPGILLYAFYANSLFLARNWVEQDKVPTWLGMGWLPLLMLVIGFFLWFPPSTGLDLWRNRR